MRWIYLIDDNIHFVGLWRGGCCNAAHADAATSPLGSTIRIGCIIDVVVAAVAADASKEIKMIFF